MVFVVSFILIRKIMSVLIRNIIVSMNNMMIGVFKLIIYSDLENSVIMMVYIISLVVIYSLIV